MPEIFAFPWGILIILFLAYSIWQGRYEDYLESLKINADAFFIIAFSLFLGSLFSVLLPIPGRKIYLNLGALTGLILPAIYWLCFRPWQNIFKSWLLAFILGFGLHLLRSEFLIKLQGYLPPPPWFIFPLSALIMAAFTNSRHNAYGALILGFMLNNFLGAITGSYGYGEIGGLALINNIICSLFLIEPMLIIKARLQNAFAKKGQAEGLTNTPG